MFFLLAFYQENINIIIENGCNDNGDDNVRILGLRILKGILEGKI
jgi:hypothetical protein